tara:strand:- start:45 stop:539 length:495 start_codon:yes stop_codon:yes gene_type:complete
MALNDKKYEKFYKTDGTGDDKAKAEDLAKAEELWDLDRAKGCEVYLNHPDFAPLIFQLQQMQDELDALRTEIALNKDKSTFPGIGTSGSTCLAGDTTTITTSQASAITANTSKVSFPITTAVNNALSFSINGQVLTITNTVLQVGKPGQPTPKPKVFTTTLNLK